MATKGKIRDMISILRKDGWIEVKSGGGDHRQFKHLIKRGKVTVDGKTGDDVTAKRWNQMLVQAGLR